MIGRIRLASERGSVLVSGMLFSLALLLVIGVAIDLARAFIIRRELVTVADDAALSGSQALDLQAIHAGRLALDPNDARASARRALATAARVRGQVSASAGSVTVTVRRRVPTTLLRLAGTSTLDVSARATAAPRAP